MDIVFENVPMEGPAMVTGLLVLANWIDDQGEAKWSYNVEGDMNLITMYGLMGRMAAEMQKDITINGMKDRDRDYGDE
jgi:hypothetical protein